MRCLPAAAVVALLVAAPALAGSAADGHTVVVGYTAGPGDLACLAASSALLQGVGCVVVFPLAGDSRAQIAVHDTATGAVGARVGFAVCSPNCGGSGSLGVGCGIKTVDVVPGQRVLVFLDDALGPLDCPLAGAAVVGTVAVTFT